MPNENYDHVNAQQAGPYDGSKMFARPRRLHPV